MNVYMAGFLIWLAGNQGIQYIVEDREEKVGIGCLWTILCIVFTLCFRMIT